MQKIIRKWMCFTASLLMLGSCEESKRFEISGNDNTPPGKPEFVACDPLPGGARIFFRPPKDEDVLYIEASYVSEAGKLLRFSASYFSDYIDVLGFGREGDHVVELCAVDRAGNRSASVKGMVKSLEPLSVSVANTVKVLPSFSSMLVKWSNVSMEPVYVWVSISYTQNGAQHDYTTVFTTAQSETRSIDSLKLYANEPVSVKVSVRDMFDNNIQAKDTTIKLLTDGILDKREWRLISAGSTMDGVSQVNGQRLEALIDGEVDTDFENYFITMQSSPWNIIIDLGEEYELSRIVTHQRWSGFNGTYGAIDYQGNLYRGDNVLNYNLYGWNKTSQTWKELSRQKISSPVVTAADEYTILGKRGDMAYIYPEEPQFSTPTRWFRFEAVTGKYISEITLYGRKAY